VTDLRQRHRVRQRVLKVDTNLISVSGMLYKSALIIFIKKKARMQTRGDSRFILGSLIDGFTSDPSDLKSTEDAV
jgi:hypothetical protein